MSNELRIAKMLPNEEAMKILKDSVTV